MRATEISRELLIAFYLEYFNQWITISSMAEYYEMPKEDCRLLVELGKKYYEESVNKEMIY